MNMSKYSTQEARRLRNTYYNADLSGTHPLVGLTTIKNDEEFVFQYETKKDFIFQSTKTGKEEIFTEKEILQCIRKKAQSD